MDDRLTGYIRKLVDEGGPLYGFITGDNGIEYFFIPRFVQKSVPYSFNDLQVGNRVEFVPIAGGKVGQYRALEIRRIDGGSSSTATGPVAQPS